MSVCKRKPSASLLLTVKAPASWSSGTARSWTAAHVVKNVSSVEIHQRFRYNGKPAGEQVFSGHVICRLPDTDVALVWVDAPPDRLTGGHWASSTPGPGIPVLCVGNMLGRDLDGSVSAGIVSQNGVSPTNMESWPWKLVDQATVVAVPGSSGGPVFDARGDIVGIAVGWPGISSITFFVPLRVVYSAAQQANVTWAIYGSHAPIDKVLQDAVTSAAPPPVPQDIIRLLFGFDPAEPSK